MRHPRERHPHGGRACPGGRSRPGGGCVISDHVRDPVHACPDHAATVDDHDDEYEDERDGDDEPDDDERDGDDD